MLLRARIFDLPGVVHGFTTRVGGVSEGSFGSLNVSAKRGDTAQNVEENLQRICTAGAFRRERLARVKQVHGDRVLAVDALEPTSEADGLWTRRDGAVASVTTADCVPVLILDASNGLAAAVHSGWRGTVADVSGRAVATLLEAGADETQLRAAIGPCIEVAAFEVGDEVAERFASRYVERDGYVRPHVDLVACVRDQLAEAGVRRDQIERVGGRTHAHPERFFSYRRDGAATGQALSFVGFSG